MRIYIVLIFHSKTFINCSLFDKYKDLYCLRRVQQNVSPPFVVAGVVGSWFRGLASSEPQRPNFPSEIKQSIVEIRWRWQSRGTRLEVPLFQSVQTDVRQDLPFFTGNWWASETEKLALFTPSLVTSFAPHFCRSCSCLVVKAAFWGLFAKCIKWSGSVGSEAARVCPQRRKRVVGS